MHFFQIRMNAIISLVIRMQHVITRRGLTNAHVSRVTLAMAKHALKVM